MGVHYDTDQLAVVKPKISVLISTGLCSLTHIHLDRIGALSTKLLQEQSAC